MTTNIANIALTGLRAAQAGMAVTANNISNQGTPGYSRQQVVLESSMSTFSGAGYFGLGVDVVTVQRAYSEFLSSQASQSASTLSYLTTYSDQMSGLINQLGSVDTGINQSLNALYTALSSFSQNPSEAASRQSALAAAQSTAARFRAVSEDLSRLGQGIDRQATATVGQINQLVQSIAAYNAKIGDAYAAGNGQAPNGLLDQRDVLVRELGQLTGITTSTQGSSINIYLTNGQPLVMEHLASQLQIEATPGALPGANLSLTVGGHTVPLKQGDVEGGQLGALLQFRDNELAHAHSELGRLAIAMAAAYNQQQQFGIDGTGQPGQALFRLGGPVAVAARGNTGDATVAAAIADTRSLTGSDYQLSRVGTEYVLTRLDDGMEFGPFATLPQEVDGLTIGLAGGDLNDGDVFTINVARHAAAGMEVLLGSPAQLAAAAPMALETPATNTGTALASRLRSVASGAADYGSSVTVRFLSATGYELLAEDGAVLATGTLEPPQQTISYNGWAFDLSGIPAAGDTVTVRADPGDPSGDNRNALALATLGTTKIAGGSTLTDSYAALISEVGTRAASLNVSKAAQQTAHDQAISAEQALSGVNLDEEGANLLRYQQAYAAAGKVLSMSAELFDQLLAAIH
ncbi:MAG: flagellar hook-associated protein FlgK [Pigmentiphaga sp.]|uniref:flagellar hook-associated protein FlgK n=1 Tax=Pigmentiphaga sp. TaxID=1977564 RepID=UPI0029A3C769|nr:flagellar hook-associated protein FlgK [Pigmentiphaga sp.]MDX3904105.1 flagellar hook-associated protein FlgK [Pigmentiphaga sp.]